MIFSTDLPPNTVKEISIIKDDENDYEFVINIIINALIGLNENEFMQIKLSTYPRGDHGD